MSKTDYKVVFVGGAPRTGTTLTHAMICTSDEVNRYVAESSYFKNLINAYISGITNWDGHTNSFYSSKEHFTNHMRNLLWTDLDLIHNHLGKPKILALKDPLLTPLFPEVRELLGDRVKFVTVVRNPYDVVRSRQEVFTKMNPEGKFAVSHARFVVQEYLRSYKHIYMEEMKDQLLVVRYDDLKLVKTRKAMMALLDVKDIDIDKLWNNTGKKEKVTKKSENGKDPWYSPKYHGPIDLKNRHSELGDEFKKVVDFNCKEMQIEFKYAKKAKTEKSNVATK